MQVKFKGKQKKTVFLVFPSLKDFGGFKDRPERCHDNMSGGTVKIDARENPYKNGEFLVGF